METSSPIANLDREKTLAVLATASGYFVFPKWETMGVINGFTPLSDEDIHGACARGIIVADARALEGEQLSRLTYLNTLVPVPNSAAGPSGTRNLIHVDAWLAVCSGCGIEIINAAPSKLTPALFTREYATRLMAEGLLETNSGAWAPPRDDGFLRTRALIGSIDALPLTSANDLQAEAMRGKFKNLVIGEAIVAQLKGQSDRSALSRALSKAKEWIEHTDAQIKKVPALSGKVPSYTMKQCTRLIAKELETLNQALAGPSR